MKANFIIALVTSMLYFTSCMHHTSKMQVYHEDSAVSDSYGTPLDSVTHYFPYAIKKNNKQIVSGIDSFMSSMYSVVMYALQEQVLYNYYLGHDQYRFAWFRSFDPPITFTIHRKGDDVWLHIKMLESYPHIGNEMYTYFDSISNKLVFTDSVLQSTEFRGNIVLDKTKQLTLNDWETFENLLQETGYWSMTPSDNTFGMDGSRWIVEAHLKDKYWVVNRWSPKSDFSRIGHYLIDVSGLKERVY